jgi:Fe-S oxidoreductase
VGSAFLALALLAWGKWMHPLATTANLVIRGGRTHSDGTAPQGLALDACTRCGQCSLHCSVAPSFRVLGNRDILPMEKLADLRAWLAQTDRATPPALLVEGSHICTECLRCTEICPAGIDLQDLWMRSKGALADAGRAGVDGEIRKRSAAQWAQELARRHVDAFGPSGSGLADRAESFWGCVQCTTCTSVCPVVAVSPDPARDLDLTPQQIMNYLRMGLKAQTLGARMVWSCTTCYKCQEYCPQGVPVADILYELRNLGAEVLRRKEDGA